VARKSSVPSDPAQDNGQPVPGDASEPEGPTDTSFDPAEFEKPATPGTAEPDPFDPETYRVRQTLAAAKGVKEHLTELPVRTPDPAWWVRRHPDPAYSLTTSVINLREERETYLVAPALFPSLQGEPTLKRKTFFLATTMQGKLFLWPVRVPVDDSKDPDRWMKKPLEAVRSAKHQWTRIYWDDEIREHRVQSCEIEAEPEWPSDLSPREMIRLAFKDYLIDSLDHPVIRRLRGKSK
jgi:hypothetical protein